MECRLMLGRGREAEAAKGRGKDRNKGQREKREESRSTGKQREEAEIRSHALFTLTPVSSFQEYVLSTATPVAIFTGAVLPFSSYVLGPIAVPWPFLLRSEHFYSGKPNGIAGSSSQCGRIGPRILEGPRTIEFSWVRRETGGAPKQFLLCIPQILRPALEYRYGSRFKCFKNI